MEESIACCKLYVSEARNAAAMESIEQAAKHHPETVIINKFDDSVYNRVRYTLVSYVTRGGEADTVHSPLQLAVLAMVEAAYGAIDLELHSGAHPRLGVVDHICFHPLGKTSLEQVAWLARSVAASIGNKLQVPVFLYEAAHPEGRSLDAIRRELGYFQPNFMGNQWSGCALSEILPVEPDEGPARVDRARGTAIIGASPWVENYNVPVLSPDIVAVKRIARQVSGRGGGLPGVQAMALVHGEKSTEVACILLEPSTIGADRVQRLVELLAREEGLEVEKGYFTDFPQEVIVDKYMKHQFTQM